jgi:hypothetical protein
VSKRKKKDNHKHEPDSYIKLVIALINLIAAILLLVKNNSG